jgi:hypothetical protein
MLDPGVNLMGSEVIRRDSYRTKGSSQNGQSIVPTGAWSTSNWSDCQVQLAGGGYVDRDDLCVLPVTILCSVMTTGRQLVFDVSR